MVYRIRRFILDSSKTFYLNVQDDDYTVVFLIGKISIEEAFIFGVLQYLMK